VSVCRKEKEWRLAADRCCLPRNGAALKHQLLLDGVLTMVVARLKSPPPLQRCCQQLQNHR
jgi:hypothetical protein